MHDRLVVPPETTLHHQLRSSFGDLEILGKLFRHANEANMQLGSWCSDQIWSYLVEGDDGQRVASRLESEIMAGKTDSHSQDDMEAQFTRLRQAVDLIRDHRFEQTPKSTACLSSKVLLLKTQLEQIFCRPTEDKCIVFVRKRYTARLLADLFSRIDNPFIRAGTLLGARKGDPADLVVTYRQQFLTMLKFRKGTLNCLVGWISALFVLGAA